MRRMFACIISVCLIVGCLLFEAPEKSYAADKELSCQLIESKKEISFNEYMVYGSDYSNIVYINDAKKTRRVYFGDGFVTEINTDNCPGYAKVLEIVDKQQPCGLDFGTIEERPDDPVVSSEDERYYYTLYGFDNKKHILQLTVTYGAMIYFESGDSEYYTNFLITYINADGSSVEGYLDFANLDLGSSGVDYYSSAVGPARDYDAGYAITSNMADGYTGNAVEIPEGSYVSALALDDRLALIEIMPQDEFFGDVYLIDTLTDTVVLDNIFTWIYRVVGSKEKQNWYLVNADGLYQITYKDKAQITKETKDSIKLSKITAKVKVGKKTKVTFADSLNMTNVKKITYSSSDKNIATVSKNGYVTGKSVGTVNIKAKVTMNNGVSKTVTLKVTVK